MAACPWFTTLLMVPSVVTLANAEYFIVSYGEIIRPFALVALTLFGVSLTALRCVPSTGYTLAPGFLLISILAMATSQIFAPMSPLVFDGNKGSIATSPAAMFLEVAAILSIVVVCSLGRKILVANRALIASILLAWGVGNIGLSMSFAPSDLSVRSVTTGPNAYPVESTDGPIDAHAVASKNFNIFHIMADSLQSDVFAEIVTENTEVRDAFAGFVHFEDHGGYSNWTTMSLLSIFTQNPLFEIDKSNDALYTETIASLMANQSFVEEFREQGFYVTAVQPGLIFCKYTEYPCVQVGRFANQLQSFVDQRAGAAPQRQSLFNLSMVHAQVTDLSLFRLLPAYWKNAAYNDGSWLVSSHIQSDGSRFANMRQTEIEIQLSVETLRYVTEHISPTLESPVYHFLHLYPPHRPFILDESCNFTDQLNVAGNAYSDGTEWSAYKMQSQCVLGLLAEFFARLKELSIYDSSVIVLQSDTGLGMVSPTLPARGPADFESDKIASLSPQRLAAYANPALAIKQRYATAEFSSSDRPTHHLDSFSIVTNLASVSESDAIGGSQATDGPSRTRSFVISDAVREETTVLANQRFEITGKIKDLSSWREVGLFEHNRPVAYQPVSKIQVDYRLSEPGEGSTARVAFEVTTVGGIQPLLYRVYELDSNRNLREARSYQPNNLFSISIPEDRADRCKVEFTVIVRDTVSPHVEVQQQVLVPLGYLPDCQHS